MVLTAWLPVFTVAVAIVGAVFAALRFNRDDASAVVVQQSTVLNDMKALNVELVQAVERIRGERDELLETTMTLNRRLAELTTEVHSLKSEVQSLRTELTATRRGGRRVTD